MVFEKLFDQSFNWVEKVLQVFLKEKIQTSFTQAPNLPKDF